MLPSWCRMLRGRFQPSEETEVAATHSGTSARVDDLGFVDLLAEVVDGRQARGVADRTVDVDHPIAGSTDEVVVVVTDPVLVADPAGWMCRRRPFSVRAARASYTAWTEMDLGPDGLGHGVGCHVGFIRDRLAERPTVGP